MFKYFLIVLNLALLTYSMLPTLELHSASSTLYLHIVMQHDILSEISYLEMNVTASCHTYNVFNKVSLYMLYLWVKWLHARRRLL